MTKRLTALLTALVLLLGTMILPASAYDPFRILSAYYQQEEVCLFLSLEDAAGYSAKIRAGDSATEDVISIHTTQRETLKTEYLFLIDTARSMPVSSEQVICGLAQGLTEKTRQEVTITVASFGSEFTLIDEDLTDIHRIRAAIGGVEFDRNNTNLIAGVAGAVSYLREKDRTTGKLTNVVIFSDGSSAARNMQQISGGKNLLQSIIRSTTEALIHAVCLGSWDTDTLEALQATKGMKIKAMDGTQSYDAGRKMDAAAGELCWMIAGAKNVGEKMTLPVQLTLTDSQGSSNQLMIDNVTNLDVQQTMVMVPQIDDQVPSQPAETHPQETVPGETIPEETVPEETGTEETTPGETNPEETDAAETVSAGPAETIPDPTETTLPAVTEEPVNEDGGNAIGWYVAGGMLVVILVLVFLLLRGRGRSAKTAVQAGIPLQMEVLAGKCKTAQRQFYLNQELVIGSDNGCDIVWKDPSVAPRHCRIYLKDSLIWLEDLNDRSDTTVDGIKIYAPNCLRSEDEIAIGNVRFRFLF